MPVVFDMLVEGKELSKAERGEVKFVARALLDSAQGKEAAHRVAGRGGSDPAEGSV